MRTYRVVYVKRLYVSCVEWVEADNEDAAWSKAEARCLQLDSSCFDNSEADGDEVWVEDIQDEGETA